MECEGSQHLRLVLIAIASDPKLEVIGSEGESTKALGFEQGV